MIVSKYIEELELERVPLMHVYRNVVLAIAERSSCPKGKRHGAVAIVDGRLVATGYNGPAAKVSHCSPCSLVSDINGKDWRTCPAVHAEENVIANAARHGISINKCVLLVTKKPCERCMGLLINAGIKEVIYLED